ncbi:MAG: tandem-95 repeat protein [Oscillatoriales cyanobacterium C42_A2020_001]|nr:tandem-95 repeat protein [Leptolyngbyaceae cyanobacterium C42_A2020_001]
MPDSIGNTLNDARSIVIGTTTKQFSDSVEFGDNDYFRFTLNRASSFALALYGLSANAEVEVLNSSGNLVTADTVPLRSANEGTLTESINTILGPGTYFIRVFPGAPTDPTNPTGTTPSTNYTLDVRADNGISNDIVWRYYAAEVAATGIWRMDGTNFVSGQLVDPPQRDALWRIVGTADVNGDNSYDFLWRYYGDVPGFTGTNGFWLLDNGTVTTFFPINPEPDLTWQIRGMGNFDGGVGKPDILWHNPITGALRVWFLDDAYNVTAVAPIDRPIAGGWQIQALGDFNGDGNTDLIWRLNDFNAIWYMNQTSVAGIAEIIGEPNVNKRIQGAGDFNSDGSPDLLWRNFATGENEVWLMEGTSRTAIVPILGVSDPAWEAITPFERTEPLTLLDLAGTGAPGFGVGPLNGSGIYRDSIEVNDTNDFYQFSLGSRTRLNLSLDGLGTNALQGNLDLEILSATGAVVGRSANGGTANETIADLDLNPGTYFFRVFAGQNGAASAYDLNLSVNNLPVLVSSGPLTVSEGQTQTLSNTLLLVTDENDPATRLTYTYASTLQNGSLLSNGQALIANSTFTQADINAGRIVYQQNGGEAPTDTFVFGVSDGRGGVVPNTTFTINVVPVNDPPQLRSLNTLTVSEGQLATLSNSTLLVTDTEQPAAQIIYSINSLPTAGTLSLIAGAVTGPLTLGSTFTQADIDANRLAFRQSGSETTSDSFTFVATDGAGGFLNPQVQTLSVNVIPVDDPPVLVTNVALTVNQAGPNVIRTSLLEATDAEFTSPVQRDLIKYSVTALPTEGTLFLNATAQTAPFTFSQADINAGALAYAQRGTPTNSDRFNFRLSDGTNIVPNTGDFTYEIFVQRVAGPPVLETTNPRLTLSEGETTTVSSTILRVTDPDSAAPFITFTLGSTPTTGQLLRLGTALTTGQTFSQDDINNGRIAYRHNGNEQPLTDAFTFTFKDETGQGPANAETLSVNIISTNDLPTILTINTQITVTEGFAVDLTPNLLNVTDPDNLAQQITYTVAPDPTGGIVLRSGTQVSSFTQADVNSGQIKYLQNGSESTSDSFSFTVTDLSGTPVGPGTVNISVIPFNDAPGIASLNPITLNEGDTATILDASLLITDNDGPGPITYTVGTLPTNGIIRRGNVTLSTGGTFTQAEVTNGQLFYVNNGAETTSDRFTFTASDGATTGLGAPGLIGERTFNITVTPVNDTPGISVNTGLTLSEGALSVINSARLRTTDPDNIASQLTYNILTGPSSGTLLSSGTAVTSFTQSQINGNLISYRQNGDETTLDAFIFEVTDGSTSTGAQTFNISITPVNDIPTIVANTGLTVDEGSVAVLSDAALLATDPDGPSESVIFTIGAAPTRGFIIRDAITLTNGQTFTQADISSGLISYANNGTDPVANDRFTFTASDGTPTGTLSLRTFSLTVSPINDAPIVSAPLSVSALEDQTFTFAGNNVINVADIDGGPTYAAVISSSSGGTINLGSTTGLTGLSGNGSSFVTFNAPIGNLNAALNNLRYRGVQNFNGTETLAISINDGNGGATDRTVTLNVAPVNDAPTLTASTATLSILEDQTPPPTVSFTVTDVDSDLSPIRVTLRATNGSITVTDPGTLTFVDNTANGSSTVTFTGLLSDVQTALAGVTYQSNLNYFGSDRIIATVDDQGATGGTTGLTASQTINVTVTPVNDRPTFTVTGSSVINVNEDVPQQTVPFIFAPSISTGAPNETQGLSFSIAPSSPADANLLTALFTATPSINLATGNLTFTPRANANGTVSLSAFLIDNGGTANGGFNTSEPFAFVIGVNQVNDAPSFTRGTVPNVTEDGGPITINNWATNISVGPSTPAANESTQTPTFLFETSNPSLFASGPEVVNLSGNTAALTFTPAPDANGIATVTVRLQDSGGTENGGRDTSNPQTFTINVLSRNDAPTFTQAVTDVVVLEDDPQQSVQIATDIVVGPSNELTQTATFTITANSNPNLFLASGGGLAPTINPQGFLTFKTAANAFGSAILTARLVDNGGTQNGGANQSAPFTFTINATPVNDAPTFTKGTDRTVNEDAPAQTVVNWATNINPGPNESTQTRTFGVETSNPALFAPTGQPAIDSTGRLTYTPAANAFGTAIVTVSLVDNGGTDNGGIDTSAPQTFTITVNPVNDAPTFTNVPGGQTTQEDQPITFTGATAIQFTDIDSGMNPIEVRLTVRNGTVLLPSTNGLNVASGSNGGSTVTFTGTVDDFTTAFASLIYTPNRAFNGTDGLTVVVNDRGFFGSGGTRSITTSVPITITPVNNPPELLSLGQLLVNEGGNGLITNTLLRTTDVDNPPAQVVYTLANTPTNGALRLSAGAGFTTIAANGTFTQADIDAGRLSYIQNGSEATSDNFVFRVSDGQITLPDATFDISVIPVDDAPTQAANAGVALSEGGVATIDGTLLQFTDNDDPPSAIVYTINSAPSAGILRLGGTDLSTGGTFTQEQLDNGQLTYEQNGSERTSDSFNFLVGDGTTNLQGSFNISIQPVNDPPTVVSRGPLTVNEGSSAPISSSILNTSDPDTPSTQIVYTVTGSPIFGNLLRNNSGTISNGQTFTQAELNAGAISYRQNGSENASDVFVFNVSDGGTPVSDIVNINVLPVNDPPVLVTNTGLSLRAGTPATRTLSSSQLRATDVDNPTSDQVFFRLTTLPSAGTLRVNGAALAVGQAFSQRDIELGRVSYQYSGTGSSDGFQFTVVDANNTAGGTGFFSISFTA